MTFLRNRYFRAGSTSNENFIRPQLPIAAICVPEKATIDEVRSSWARPSTIGFKLSVGYKLASAR